jgi:hypothetical protein
MRLLLSWSVLGVALLVWAAPAVAQAPRPERPYRGLFGSGTGDAGQLLTATASVGAGFDDNVLADALGRSTPVVSSAARAGTVTTMSAGLAYSVETDAMTMGLSAGSSARYYPGNSTKFVRGSQGRMTLGMSPRTGTSVALGLSVASQPYQFSSLYPLIFEQVGEAPIPDLDIVATSETYVSYGGSASVSQRVSRRLSFGASYAQRRADRNALVNSIGEVRDGREGQFINQTAGAGLTYNIGRGLDVRSGYTYGEARYGDERTREHHSIDAGVNYNRSLSISRRTVLSFATGSSGVRSEERLRFMLTGNVALQHEIGRTWNAQVGYSRQVLINETWPEPVLADSVSVGVGGLITRRVQFVAVARGALGRLGVDRNAPGFDSAHASASINYALGRFVNLGVTYSYYQQHFGEGMRLSQRTLTSADRQSVRATVNMWAPLFQRARRSNAAR